MKRIVCLLLLALLILVTGCSGFGGSVPAKISTQLEEEPISFTVVYAAGDISHKKGISTIIADFEKSHPNVTINEMNENWAGSYTDYLKMKDAIGEFPDLVEMRETQMFVDAGLLAEIPDDIRYKFKIAPEINGNVYTAPIDLPSPEGMIYNKRSFAEAGIDQIPQTYEQFLEACEKLKAAGFSPIVVGAKDLWHMGFLINKFLIDEVYMAHPDWNAMRSRGEVSWSDPGPRRAMMKLAALWEQDYVMPGFLSISDNQTASILASGEAAMLYSGPWMFNEIASVDPAQEFGFFALPDDKGRVNVATMPAPVGWSISAESAADPEKLKVIKQFLHYFYSELEYPKYVEAVNGIPSIDIDITYRPSEAMDEVLRVMKDPETGQSTHMNTFWGENELPPMFRNWFYKEILDSLSGKKSMEQVLSEADEEWDRELEALKEQS